MQLGISLGLGVCDQEFGLGIWTDGTPSIAEKTTFNIQIFIDVEEEKKSKLKTIKDLDRKF